MKTLLGILPNPEDYKSWDCYPTGATYCYFTNLDTAVAEALPQLRELAGGCPACIMAALRQKGIPVPLARDFDFSKECQDIWNEFNSARLAQERY
jgi:hypothetical protein